MYKQLHNVKNMVMKTCFKIKNPLQVDSQENKIMFLYTNMHELHAEVNYQARKKICMNYIDIFQQNKLNKPSSGSIHRDEHGTDSECCISFNLKRIYYTL